ncbi:MAG: hypothetical protein QY307_01375 [Acidimicrobiia bacterium]|nr:MAG: hypothetical protein QY307_01375 [Acidimicrobiia bacterium]
MEHPATGHWPQFTRPGDLDQATAEAVAASREALLPRTRRVPLVDRLIPAAPAGTVPG